MGRWAQRRRSGGGPPATTALIRIDFATLGGEFEIDAHYTADIDAGDFNPINFSPDPTGISPTSVTQGDPDSLVLTFAAPVDEDTSLTYNGPTPGVLSPQTVPIT